MASDEADKRLSLEEISKLRGSAQENSMDAIRAAEERYHKAKDTGHRSEEGEVEPSLEDISNMRAKAQQNSMEAIRAAEERYHKAKDTGGAVPEKAKQ